jgi:hypothetical protein
MVSTVLSKDNVIDILKASKKILRLYHRMDIGAWMLLKIENALVDLDCDVHNILQYASLLRRITCILESGCNRIDYEDYKELDVYVQNLTSSYAALNVSSIKEIKGKDCSKEYVRFGFERCWYRSKYQEKKYEKAKEQN